ncbi:unnamed protein product [Trifolium pratense]|uniref:Uncharacterized protein n=1 Tax=Trifolium pratense TaxID=57577 RepID=A0ACB0KNW8_TRIPR|nr:unnamed protein product [Trifolium pratense]
MHPLHRNPTKNASSRRNLTGASTHHPHAIPPELKEIERCLTEGERKPWLLYFSRKVVTNLNFCTQTFCNISDPTKSYSVEIQKGTWVSLLTVQHGWYLWENKISTYVSILFLLNPLNLKKIILPPLMHNGSSYGDCILSSPPTTNDEICSIFLFSSHCPSIFYYQLGDNQWTKRCFYTDIAWDLAMKGKAPREENLTIFEDPVYCNGRLYAGMSILCGYIIVVIEKFQPNGFSINCTPYRMAKHKPSLLICDEEVISRLIGSNNVLFRIEILHKLDRVTAVFVYQFDCSQRVWEQAENIKDKVFFISSHDPAFACQTVNPETEGGRIYIALKNCNYVYIYNIEEKSIVTSPPFSNLPENLYYSRWFMPDTGYFFFLFLFSFLLICFKNILLLYTSLLIMFLTYMFCRMTDTLKEGIGKSHQIREKESKSDAIYLKDAGDKAHTKSALPLDVVEVIAKHINDVLAYLQFRASNKLLRLAAPRIQWRSSSTMSKFDDLSMCPLFVFSEKDKVFTFVHPKYGLDYKNIINYPEGKRWNLNSEICCSKDGWLLLVAVNNIGFQVFFNPFTKEVSGHPIFHKEIWNIRCFGMSDSPTSSKCVMVELVKELPTITKAYINFAEGGGYRQFTFESTIFPHYNISPAIHNGSFYFLSITGKLASIEVTRENIIWKVLEELQAPCSTCFNNFLVECDGNLLSVFESPFAKGVQVFKLNESTMTWMKVKSLNNHMIFVGKTSFSAVANIPGMENKIYFPRFYRKSVVFYSLETNNYHTFKNDEVVNYHHMREHLNGTWIQPRWH